MESASLASIALAAALVVAAGCSAPRKSEAEYRLVLPADATRLSSGENALSPASTLVLDLRGDPLDAAAVEEAVASLRRIGLPVAVWLEVARDPALADERPEWMAGLGVHEDWRERFPDAPAPRDGFVLKAWPWVPIGYAEAFARHLSRVAERLGAVPGGADVVFLSGIQGGPSACGCGNDSCRWAIDYHVPPTATPAWEPSTPARFVESVEKTLPRDSRVVPVWCVECEERDLPEEGPGARCAGVRCFHGLCWLESGQQLAAIAAPPGRSIAVLLASRALGRVPDDAGFAAEAARLLEAESPRRGGPAIEAKRLVAVVEAFAREPEAVARDVASARAAGYGSVLVAETPLPQSFEPRSVAIPRR